MALAAGRKGTLWKALIDAADGRPALQGGGRDAEALARARRLRAALRVLRRDPRSRRRARQRFLARLGPEAADPLDEFLNLALAYDDAAPPSLTGFLAYLREVEREVKRDMEHGRDEVRVMTVHGAKGLEAPIVFLPDTCTTAAGRRRRLLALPEMEVPRGVEATPFVWDVKGSASLAAIKAAREAAAALEAEERHRLLYVAMTRARDRLYVAGFEGKTRPGAGLLVRADRDGAARRRSRTTTHPDGGRVLRRCKPAVGGCAAAAAQRSPRRSRRRRCRRGPDAGSARAGAVDPARALAARSLCARRGGRAAAVAAACIRRATSRPSSRRRALAGEDRFLRGTLTHALLQHLPTLPRAGWEKAAKGFLAAARWRTRSARARGDRQGDARHPHRAGVRAAVRPAKAAPRCRSWRCCPTPSPSGRPLKLIGQIDRLVEAGDEVLIVDYKTNRPPPTKVEDVAPAYLFQLAAYRLALSEIYPGRAAQGRAFVDRGPANHASAGGAPRRLRLPALATQPKSP